jgi:hypothetical protein
LKRLIVTLLLIISSTTVFAAFYKLEGVSRVDTNLYKTRNGVYIETRYCYHYTYGEDAIYNDLTNEIIWQDKSKCNVVKGRRELSRYQPPHYQPPQHNTEYTSPLGAALTAFAESLSNSTTPMKESLGNTTIPMKPETPRITFDVTIEAFKHSSNFWKGYEKNEGTVIGNGTRYYVQCKAHTVLSGCMSSLADGNIYEAELKGEKELWIAGVKYNIERSEAAR